MADMMASSTVVVIGAGIIGLACALKLQEALSGHEDVGIEILVVAREWPGCIPEAPPRPSADYASMWAGAHVRPIPGTTAQLRREARWLKLAVAELRRQAAAEPWCGITRTPGVDLLEAPDNGYRRLDADAFERESGLRGFRRLPPAEFPDGVELGYEYETFCINPPVYCEHLLRKFLLQGGSTASKDLKSELEAYTPRDDVLLVNASGTGFGDHECFPTRGQTVVTDLTGVTKTATRQNRDGTRSYLIPRFFTGGTIVGGTVEPGDWRTEPDAASRSRVLAAGLGLVPYLHRDCRTDGVRVVSDVVGRRPTRHGGMRLELEELELEERALADGQGSTVRIIHAYGAGGRGYEMSWGVAGDVVQLAAPLLGFRGREQL